MQQSSALNTNRIASVEPLHFQYRITFSDVLFLMSLRLRPFVFDCDEIRQENQ